MKVLVTGATGFIGRHLVARLAAAGCEVRVTSRDAAGAQRLLGVPAFGWESAAVPPPGGALKGIECIVHLMGENVGKGRWTAARKREIRDSRVESTRALVEHTPPTLRAFVCASAIGYYPGHGDETYDERYVQTAGDSFMETLCRDWEAAAAAIEARGVRRVSTRFGLVLGEGGLLDTLVPVFRLGLGGPVGDGRQWMPWIHLEDVVAVLERAVREDALGGPVNVVGPLPVRYEEFARALARALHRPAFLRTPAAVLRLALGEAADLALCSYRVVPRRLTEELGYAFRHTTLDEALAAALAERDAPR